MLDHPLVPGLLGLELSVRKGHPFRYVSDSVFFIACDRLGDLDLGSLGTLSRRFYRR